mgnify:FL=1
MSTGELPTNYGDLDLLGGVVMGKYREGELAGGFSYRFEARGRQTALYIFSGEDNVFTMWSRGQGSTLLAIPERVGVFYDQAGNLGWASLNVNGALYRAHLSGRLELPRAVADNVRNQRLNEIGWIVNMNFTTYEPIVYFNQPGEEAAPPYKLEFDNGWRYPIPGTGWGVGVIRNGDLVGFEIGDVDSVTMKFWFNRSLNLESLPSEGKIAGLQVPKLIDLVFPGYELAVRGEASKGK